MLLSGNMLVKKNHDEIAKFLGQDNGMTTLKTIAHQRQKVTDGDNALEKMEKELSDNDLAYLVGSRVPESWLSQLSLQEFDDAVSFKAAGYVKAIDEITTERETSQKMPCARERRTTTRSTKTRTTSTTWRTVECRDGASSCLMAAAGRTSTRLPRNASSSTCRLRASTRSSKSLRRSPSRLSFSLGSVQVHFLFLLT